MKAKQAKRTVEMLFTQSADIQMRKLGMALKYLLFMHVHQHDR